MKKLIFILSGLSAIIFAVYTYLQIEKKKEAGPGNPTEPENKSASKMQAPASQPEVLPKSNSKEEISLVDEGATGNTD